MALVSTAVMTHGQQQQPPPHTPNAHDDDEAWAEPATSNNLIYSACSTPTLSIHARSLTPNSYSISSDHSHTSTKPLVSQWPPHRSLDATNQKTQTPTHTHHQTSPRRPHQLSPHSQHCLTSSAPYSLTDKTNRSHTNTFAFTYT